MKNRRIILGVSSSVACYKAVELARLFMKAGAEVQVVMTTNATKLVAPLQFESLTGHPVYVDVFSRENRWDVEHVAAAKWGEAMVMAPATANLLAKMAHGIADDAPTTLYLAFPGPVFAAPAMHTEMWRHPATKDNMRRLEERGVMVIPPGKGALASGDIGEGRLAEPEEIFDRVRAFFNRQKCLSGRRVLITAGPTREALDPIRFLSNRSSGLMGFLLAEEALRHGADTTIVSGPSHLADPAGIRTVRINTAREMLESVMAHAEESDVLIFSAAVSDYRPTEISSRKIKKGAEDLVIRLTRNPDIARETIPLRRPGQIRVGFAAETEDLEQAALGKMADKDFDMIVANDVSHEGIGMGAETNAALILTRGGSREETGVVSKRALAGRIWEHIMSLLEEKEQ